MREFWHFFSMESIHTHLNSQTCRQRKYEICNRFKWSMHGQFDSLAAHSHLFSLCSCVWQVKLCVDLKIDPLCSVWPIVFGNSSSSSSDQCAHCACCQMKCPTVNEKERKGFVKKNEAHWVDNNYMGVLLDWGVSVIRHTNGEQNRQTDTCWWWK